MELPLCVGHLIYRPAAAGGGLLIAVYLFKISLFSGKFKVLKIKRMHISHISFSTISIDLTGNASTISRFKMPTTNFCEIRDSNTSWMVSFGNMFYMYPLYPYCFVT